MEEARSAGILVIKREKRTALRKGNTYADATRATCMILKNQAITPVEKERLSLLNKATSEANYNKFAKESGMLDGVESLGKVNSSKNHLRAPAWV